MSDLQNSPNIGATLAHKLESIGITSLTEIREAGSMELMTRLSSRDPNGVCLIMLYALEGAVQGIRWHGLSQERKDELKAFYKEKIW